MTREVPKLNHFAISAGLGSIIAGQTHAQGGFSGALRVAPRFSKLVGAFDEPTDGLLHIEPPSKRYSTLVRKAYKLSRDGFSADRVIADPSFNKAFIATCRELGLEQSAYVLNRYLLQLRKTSKLTGLGRSRSTHVINQSEFAFASEIAARAVYFEKGLSVDAMLCHPKIAEQFDAIAAEITPGYSPFEYRWAALNVRKRGGGAPSQGVAPTDLDWHEKIKVVSEQELPDEPGLFALQEDHATLYVGQTSNLEHTHESNLRLVTQRVFDPSLWQPDPNRVFLTYVPTPDLAESDQAAIVNRLVAETSPIFNIPRAKRAA